MPNDQFSMQKLKGLNNNGEINPKNDIFWLALWKHHLLPFYNETDNTKNNNNVKAILLGDINIT